MRALFSFSYVLKVVRRVESVGDGRQLGSQFLVGEAVNELGDLLMLGRPSRR